MASYTSSRRMLCTRPTLCWPSHLFSAMINHAFELDIHTPTLTCICNRKSDLKILLSFSIRYALVMGINKPTPLLYLSTFGHIQALSNIWRWIVSLSLQLQLILFDVGIPISSLIKGCVSYNTSWNGQFNTGLLVNV